jgi:hypothetical protein
MAKSVILFDGVGRDSSVGIATHCGAGRSGDQIPVGAKFSAPIQTSPVTHPASYIMGTGSLSPSGAEVKERAELYLYSASGFSRPVLGRTLLLFYLYCFTSVPVPRINNSSPPLIRWSTPVSSWFSSCPEWYQCKKKKRKFAHPVESTKIWNRFPP